MPKKENKIVATFVISCNANMHAIHLKENGRLDFSQHHKDTGRHVSSERRMSAEAGMDALFESHGSKRLNPTHGSCCERFLVEWLDPDKRRDMAYRLYHDDPGRAAILKIDRVHRSRQN